MLHPSFAAHSCSGRAVHQPLHCCAGQAPPEQGAGHHAGPGLLIFQGSLRGGWCVWAPRTASVCLPVLLSLLWLAPLHKAFLLCISRAPRSPCPPTWHTCPTTSCSSRWWTAQVPNGLQPAACFCRQQPCSFSPHMTATATPSLTACS